MGYALRTEEQYTGLGEAWFRYPGVNLISDRLFRARTGPATRRRSWDLEVVVAGELFRLTSSRPELPEPVRESLNRISDLAEFEADWNSYGALRLNAKVVRPAIELILATFPRCLKPEISLTPSGGLNLFWSNGPAELEVEVLPNGLCDYEFENDDTGEQFAPNAPVSFKEVQKVLHHLCP